MKEQKSEGPLQNIGFLVSFDRVPWDISPKAAKELLENALRGSEACHRLQFTISLNSGSLEKP